MCRKDYGIDDGTDYGEIFLFTLPLAHPDTEDHQVASEIDSPAEEVSHVTEKETDNGYSSSLQVGLSRGEHPCRRIVFELHSKEEPVMSRRAWSRWGVAAVRDSLPTPSSSYVSDKASSVPPPTSAASSSAQERNPEVLSSDRDMHCFDHAKVKEIHKVVVWDWQDTFNARSSEPADSETEGMGRVRRSMEAEFVRGLKYGDRIALWKHAPRNSWARREYSATVTVYWAV